MTYPPQNPPQPPNGGQPGGDPFQYGQQLPTGGLDPFGGHPQSAGPGQTGWGHIPPPLPAVESKRNNTSWIIISVAAVVVVALVVAGVFWGLNRDDDSSTVAETSTAATQSSAVAGPDTTTSVSAPPSTAGSATTSAAPPPTGGTGTCGQVTSGPTAQTPPGWQTVVTPSGLAYDVPPGWNVPSCSTIIGWEKACPDGPFGTCPIRVLKGTAELPNRSPGCEKSSLAVTGTAGASKINDPGAAIRAEATTVADIYTSDSGVVPKVVLASPSNYTIGGNPAVSVVATVTGIAPGACGTTTANHWMVATTVPGQPGTVVFIVSVNNNGSAETRPELIAQILDTIRRAG
ncbi:hypothetical protein [Mycolicibacterium llatzerense]|uniref:hypothetical protein n=1 Tax=Mycolicibacterium llatzerense TaxID=280871 RepID=UPI0021B536B3|nr:hypothetical protein [Mycolicibacterium llatzerense]MCT7366650.1 hypothetical protein [Mycolicibacterium llatzerense]